LPKIDLGALGWEAELAAELEPPELPGRVAVQHRGEYVVLTELGELRARLPGRLLHSGVAAAVGDWVALEESTIVRVLPRRTALVRQAAGRETQAQVLAANVDVAFVVTSLGPDLEPRRLERYLTLVWESGATPVIVLTKADLHPDAAEQALAVEAVAIGVPVHVVSAVTGEGCDELEQYLQPGATVVLLGSSGVGKSTLVNRFAGVEVLRTQPVREDDGKGRHTTTHRELILLPRGGVLIDTPGLRELQLWETSDTAFGDAFADVEELAADCRFADCGHLHEPGCAVLAAVDDGRLPLDRLRSWRKLQRELLQIAMRHDVLLRKREGRKWRLAAQEGRAKARRR
jgi:ribosome biogenesis GTPase